MRTIRARLSHFASRFGMETRSCGLSTEAEANLKRGKSEKRTSEQRTAVAEHEIESAKDELHRDLIIFQTKTYRWVLFHYV